MTKMKRGNPTHLNGCNCYDCRAYRRQVDETYRLRQKHRSQGVTFAIDLVPVEPSRELILTALKHGTGYTAIAKLTRVQKETISRIARGERARIRRYIAQKIAAGLAQPDIPEIHNEDILPITVERQMIRCLMAQGWTKDHLAEIVKNNGKGSGQAIRILMEGKRDNARAHTLKQVYWLVEVIGDKQGPSSLTASRMQRRGIFPLKHYDPKGRLNVRSLSDQQRQWLQ